MDQLSALYRLGVGSEGAEDTLECQPGCPPILCPLNTGSCFPFPAPAALGWKREEKGEGLVGAELLGFGALRS